MTSAVVGSGVVGTAIIGTASGVVIPPVVPPVTPPPIPGALTATLASIGDLAFTAMEDSGVLWVLEDLQGWGSPKPTLNVVQRVRSDGGWAGNSYLTPRVVTLAGTVLCPLSSQLEDAIDRLNAAVSLTPTTLTVWKDGVPRTASVRRQDEVLVNQIGDRAASWSIQVVASDPRKYAAATSVSAGLPSSSGGMTWPVTWPLTWTGVTNSGVISIANAGNTRAPVTLRISGPVSGPIVTHIGSGLQLVFSSSLTLLAGEYIDVDMEARSVLAQGQASRSGYVTSRGWFSADPGVNQYAFQAQAYNSAALLTVTVPSGAWL